MLPSFGNEPFTLAGGWLWCMTEANEQDRIHTYRIGRIFDPPRTFWHYGRLYRDIFRSGRQQFRVLKELHCRIPSQKFLFQHMCGRIRSQISEIGAEIKRAISEVILQQNSPEAERSKCNKTIGGNEFAMKNKLQSIRTRLRKKLPRWINLQNLVFFFSDYCFFYYYHLE